MKKLKWYGVLFALFILFMYIMGVYDLFMMLSLNESYFISKGYSNLIVEYFTNYPMYMLIFWILNLIAGLVSPILYLFKNINSYKVAFVSFCSDLILIVLGVCLRDRFSVFSTDIIYFDIFILIITLLFGIYLYKSNKNYNM